jgi:hypothetical protein
MTTTWFCDGTVRVQGVVQVWSWLVLISAPGGSESKFNAWSCSDDQLDDREVQPVSETPTTAATAAASSMYDTALSHPTRTSVSHGTTAATVTNSPPSTLAGRRYQRPARKAPPLPLLALGTQALFESYQRFLG